MTTKTQDNYNNTHGQPTTINTQDNLKLATYMSHREYCRLLLTFVGP